MKKLAGLALLVAAWAAHAATPPIVAAASDLQFALPEIAQLFQQRTGDQVRLTFGSSGNFHQQILRGAPFALFMSADEDFVFALARKGRTQDRGTLYATGRIVLYAPHNASVALDAELRGLSAAVAAGVVRRFSIANPDHAPYGRAAREALIKAGLWNTLSGRLVLGENVSQAAQFVTSGNAQAGIIAYSLALAPSVNKHGTYVVIPEHQHAPLRQRMVLIQGADATAREFYDFLQAPEARAIFQRWGFALPGE